MANNLLQEKKHALAGWELEEDCTGSRICSSSHSAGPGERLEPVIEIGCREQDGKRVFFVQDNGIGIDPRFHEQVFGLFNKLDPHVDGTGVGLTLVKCIVEVHGGKIWLESELGKGAAFFFTLGPGE